MKKAQRAMMQTIVSTLVKKHLAKARCPKQRILSKHLRQNKWFLCTPSQNAKTKEKKLPPINVVSFSRELDFSTSASSTTACQSTSLIQSQKEVKIENLVRWSSCLALPRFFPWIKTSSQTLYSTPKSITNLDDPGPSNTTPSRKLHHRCMKDFEIN